MVDPISKKEGKVIHWDNRSKTHEFFTFHECFTFMKFLFVGIPRREAMFNQHLPQHSTNIYDTVLSRIDGVLKPEGTARSQQHTDYLEDVSVPAADSTYSSVSVPEEVLQSMLALSF